MHYANDAKTFLKHFSDYLFYSCSTCADSITKLSSDIISCSECVASVSLSLITRLFYNIVLYW